MCDDLPVDIFNNECDSAGVAEYRKDIEVLCVRTPELQKERDFQFFGKLKHFYLRGHAHEQCLLVALEDPHNFCLSDILYLHKT